MKTLTADEVRALLRAECEKAGGQRAWAREHGVSGAYVSQVLTGVKLPSDAVTIPLGLIRRETITWTLDNARNCA